MNLTWLGHQELALACHPPSKWEGPLVDKGPMLIQGRVDELFLGASLGLVVVFAGFVSGRI